MPIEIVAVDPAEMRRTALMNRAKNDNVRAIYTALFDLGPGSGKQIIAEPGDDLGKLRVLLQQCAARTGHELNIVTDRVAGRILFTLKRVDGGTRAPRGTGKSAQEIEEALARRDMIRDAALELGSRQPVISAQEVVDSLADNDLSDVSRPATAVSAVVRNMPEFEHIGQSQFRYIGD